MIIKMLLLTYIIETDIILSLIFLRYKFIMDDGDSCQRRVTILANFYTSIFLYACVFCIIVFNPSF